MAVTKGDRIKASEYNNYVMGLDYQTALDLNVKSNSSASKTAYAWMRGSRTDKNGVALPSPYPGYNTFKIYVDKSLGAGDFTKLEVYKITWDISHNEVATLKGTFFDTSFWSDGTTYYRYWEPGYYKFVATADLAALFKWQRHIKVSIKAWQNQVEVEAPLRSFLDDRSGIGDLGYREYIANKAGVGLYGDPHYLGGNHPDYTGD